MEKKEPGAWHVVVGIDFGTEITHEAPGVLALDMSLPLVSPSSRLEPPCPFRGGAKP